MTSSKDTRPKPGEETIEAVIPVAEERAAITKRVRETGTVRIDARVVADTETLRETLRSQKVDVERMPVDREVDAVPEVRSEDGVTIIPVVDEELIVTRRLVLREEIRVSVKETSEDVEVPVDVRRTEVDIDRTEHGD